MVAVVLYHIDPSVIPGGFLGVDLFFVLSGYLITSLLLMEHRHSGRISIRAFWVRRMRRLWPLAWLVLAAVSVASVAGVWGEDRQASLPWEVGAAIANVANWYQIDHGGYVQSFAAPSPLRHFWSLAIEEQFYLVWPAMAAGLLALRRRWAVPIALGLLAAASVVAGGLTRGHADRAYLGTDVRMVALVVGAAMAWVGRAHPLGGPPEDLERRWAIAVGLGGAVGLCAAAAMLHADDPRLAVGGFALAAVGAGSVVTLAMSSTVALRVLSWGPLLGAGRISYAWYLLHWPLLVALGPGRSWLLRAVVAGPVSAALAAVAHRWVERPVIERRVRRVTLVGTGAGMAALSVVALVVAAPTGPTPTERVSRSLGRVVDPTTSTTTEVPPDATTTTCVPSTAPPPTFGNGKGFDPATVEEIGDPTEGCATQIRVLVVGDSTGRGAANGLVALADERLQIWDRTVLGCSFGDEGCPDWRGVWPAAVETIDPDVVLVSTGVVSDLHGVDDASFMSAPAREARHRVLIDAVAALAAKGAGVAMVAPAPPKPPNGLFFCDGDGTDTNCDPRWVSRWIESLRTAAATSGAAIIDTAGWIAARGSTAADRPDGEHLAGAALVEYAKWLVPQLLSSARPPG